MSITPSGHHGVELHIGTTAHEGTAARVALNDAASNKEKQQLWKQVFEQSHVVPATARPEEPTSAREAAQSHRPALDHASARQASHPSAGPASRWREGSPFALAREIGAAAPPPFASPAPSISEPLLPMPSGHEPSAVTSIGGAHPSAAALPLGLRSQLATPTQPSTPQPSHENVSAPARSGPLGLTHSMSELFAASSAAAHAPLPAESIQVYQREGRVSIVIRDSALEPVAALHCAMETVRQLTGDARTLTRVTLNGRAVFERTDPTERTPGSISNEPHRISFNC